MLEFALLLYLLSISNFLGVASQVLGQSLGLRFAGLRLSCPPFFLNVILEIYPPFTKIQHPF